MVEYTPIVIHCLNKDICFSIRIRFFGCLNIIPSIFKTMNYDRNRLFELVTYKTIFLHFFCNIGCDFD